jgi:hypothetical protein
MVDGVPTAGPRTDRYDLPPVDLLVLAQQKRWQDIDTIRAVKDVVGTGLIAGGGYEAYRYGRHQNSQDAAIAAGLLATGLLLKASSQADVRTWEMLPRTSFVIPLTLPPGQHDIAVDFGPAGQQTWRRLEAPATGEATYYFRVQRYPTPPQTWPPPAIARQSRPAGPAPQGNASDQVGSIRP